ncbi:MAG TPA: hypothetical protein VK030_04535 [Actinomycetales bacterium]|nr:hypothetical protein [Actinomycetales bacterium]
MTQVLATEDAGRLALRAQSYRLEVRSNPPRAIFADLDGRIWSDINLLASLNRTDMADESYNISEPTWRQIDSECVEITVTAASAAWEFKKVTLRARPNAVELEASVEGEGTLATATLFGGGAVFPNGACGQFNSRIEFHSVFNPTPTEPVQFVRPATSASVLGVVGDAAPGRLNGIFSPPPLCLAFGREIAPGATDIPDGDWLSVSLRAPVSALSFTHLRYQPVDGGYQIALDYDGHTRVRGQFTTPTVVIQPAADPMSAIADYRADLIAHGHAPKGPQTSTPPWWREPIFCGWGAQCALAPLPGQPLTHPYYLDELGPAQVPAGLPIGPDMARQDVYDDLLARLKSREVWPGTIILDDRWQEHYGSAEPHPARWPDLRAWIAARQSEGHRVLLWWKAWDPAGIPAEECVIDPAENAVTVDPGNPAYRQRLTQIVQGLVGPEGLNADGFKIDFTQRAPAGQSLRAWSDTDDGEPVWGIAGVYKLLQTLYEAAKSVKPEALIITHTPHPSFADVCDMVRTNDVLERDPSGAVVPVADQLSTRVDIVRAAMPNHLIDTDQWPMPDREQWRAYVQQQVTLGVPALYYVYKMDRSDEELGDADLDLVAETWKQYRREIAAHSPESENESVQVEHP